MPHGLLRRDRDLPRAIAFPRTRTVMAVHSYLVIPAEGAADALVQRLAAIPGCDVARAQNRDILILVTDTPGRREEDELRARLERVEGVRTLILTFGEVQRDPHRAGERTRTGGRLRLPVLGPRRSGTAPDPSRPPTYGDP